MKTEYRLFCALGGALLAGAVVYWWWTKAALGTHEIAGTIALSGIGLLCLMCGGYFWFVSRRIPPRPEDRPDAQIADAAGQIGFFSPGSYWPVGIAAACTVAGFGLVFGMWWLLGAGLLATIAAAAGLLFEYYTGTRRGAER